MADITTEVVTSERELAALEVEWDALVARAGIDHPFTSHAWTMSWWQAFGGSSELRVVLIRVDGELEAIAPLMLTSERKYGNRVRSLTFLANDHSPRCDFIIAGGSHEVHEAIWDFVAQSAPEWDVVVLRELASGSSTAPQLLRRAEASGTRCGRRRSANSPVLHLDEGWEERLPSKRRKFLRYSLRRLSAIGPVRMDVVSGGERLQEALDDGFALEGAAWKDAAGTAIRSTPDTERFYRLLAERTAERGWLRLQFLIVGEQRIAFGYSLVYGRKMFLLKPGFDPQYAAHSPGSVLCHLAVQDAFAAGLVAYEFLGEDDWWKRQWTNDAVSHEWLFLYADRPLPRLAHYAKFAVLPALQQFPIYHRLRDRIFGSHS